MPKHFLITRRIPACGIEHLEKYGKVTVNPHDRALTQDELITLGHECDGWLTMLTDAVSDSILEKCPKLRGISNYAVGYNNIDVAACTRRKIAASNTPDVLTDATAELTWALILATSRRVVEADGYVRRGQWHGWSPLEFLGSAVTGKTLGIIGTGRIGCRVAEMARGFNMRIVYSGRRDNPALEQTMAARRMELAELLNAADIVSLHLPLTPGTRHILGPSEFEQMKPTAILINTGRGPLIDETALIAALRSRRIAAAGLDVFEYEPQLTPGLVELPNVVVLPHIGSATVETRNKMAMMAAESLTDMMNGRRPPHCLNPEVYG